MKNSIIIQSGDVNVSTKKEKCQIIVQGDEVAKLLILPSFEGDLDIQLKKNSNLELVLLKGINTSVSIKEAAVANITTLDLKDSSSTTIVNLEEENARVSISCLVMSKNKEETNQMVYHKARNTISEINNYGISIDKGQIYFDTTGKIENKMDGSNCRQLSKGIILGEEGIIRSKPILLIDEFNVLAYHGASIGKINEDDLFYLMSRGLSMKEAYALVLNGLIQPFLNAIEDEKIKKSVQEQIANIM